MTWGGDLRGGFAGVSFFFFGLVGRKGVIYAEVVDEELLSPGFLDQGICTLLYCCILCWRGGGLLIWRFG